MTSGSSAEKGDVLILLGTRKGGFILNSDQARKSWSMTGPYCPGSEVFHMVYDQREGGKVFAASNNMIWGPDIQFSDNLGQSWASSDTQPNSPATAAPQSRTCGTWSPVVMPNRECSTWAWTRPLCLRVKTAARIRTRSSAFPIIRLTISGSLGWEASACIA